MTVSRTLRVGVVGFGWMGQVHARAWARLLQHYPDAPCVRARRRADPDAERRNGGPRSYGFADAARDWRELLERDDLDVVQRVRTELRAPRVGVAVAESGRHLWIEKPAGRNAAETARDRGGGRGGRRAVRGRLQLPQRPGRRVARELVAAGGSVRSETVEVRFLADYAAHPDGGCRGGSTPSTPAPACSATWSATASTWPPRGRRRRSRAGRRPGDLHHPAAGVERAAGRTSPGAARARAGGRERGLRRRAAAVRLRGPRHARRSRVAVGEQCTYGIDGARRPRRAGLGLPPDGRAAGLPRPGLPGRDLRDPPRRPRRRRPAAFQPGAGIAMGFDDLKVVEAERLVHSIAKASHTAPPSRTHCAPPGCGCHAALDLPAQLGGDMTTRTHGRPREPAAVHDEVGGRSRTRSVAVLRGSQHSR